jgi:hypothetical protein
MHQPLAAVPVVVLEPSDQPLVVQVLAAEASWERRAQQALHRAPAEPAELANHAAASVQAVFLAAAAAVVDSLVAVAPVADLQELPDARVMIKEPVAVAQVALLIPVA